MPNHTTKQRRMATVDVFHRACELHDNDEAVSAVLPYMAVYALMEAVSSRRMAVRGETPHPVNKEVHAREEGKTKRIRAAFDTAESVLQGEGLVGDASFTTMHFPGLSRPVVNGSLPLTPRGIAWANKLWEKVL